MVEDVPKMVRDYFSLDYDSDAGLKKSSAARLFEKNILTTDKSRLFL